MGELHGGRTLETFTSIPTSCLTPRHVPASLRLRHRPIPSYETTACHRPNGRRQTTHARSHVHAPLPGGHPTTTVPSRTDRHTRTALRPKLALPRPRGPLPSEPVPQLELGHRQGPAPLRPTRGGMQLGDAPLRAHSCTSYTYQHAPHHVIQATYIVCCTPP